MGKLIKFIAVFILIYAAFSLAGFLFPVDRPWYDGLDKPSWTPSGSTIGIIWAILYGFIAFSVTYAGFKNGFKQLGVWFWSTFIINYITNQLFSFFQFDLKDLLLAAVDTSLVALSSLLLVILLFRWEKLSALLLIPYFLWSLFATFLAFTFFQMNPDQTFFSWM
ncbi:TspO/MBR family protein [Thalassobacillus devorans]|uniref:TspO/MBR family protein n=1 Tax=Thalassobacillus devorans TaxID=279813 RepID=UPI000A1CD901|nr:tryptophan-rich sensory protein [Thalassobacillus devorans]